MKPTCIERKRQPRVRVLQLYSSTETHMRAFGKVRCRCRCCVAVAADKSSSPPSPTNHKIIVWNGTKRNAVIITTATTANIHRKYSITNISFRSVHSVGAPVSREASLFARSTTHTHTDAPEMHIESLNLLQSSLNVRREMWAESMHGIQPIPSTSPHTLSLTSRQHTELCGALHKRTNHSLTHTRRRAETNQVSQVFVFRLRQTRHTHTHTRAWDINSKPPLYLFSFGERVSVCECISDE